MASTTRRHWFGGSGNDYTAGTQGSNKSVVVKPGERLFVWDAAEDGNRITDLLNESAVEIDELLSDEDTGDWPRFQARVGDTKVWIASASGGERTLALATDLDEDIAAAEEAISDIEVGAAGQTANGQRFWGYYTNFGALPSEGVEDGDFAIVIVS